MARMKRDALHREFLDAYDRERGSLEVALTNADRQLLVRLREIPQLLLDTFRLLLYQKETVHRISAFGIYSIDSIHLLRRATTEALCCYYSIGTAMLRIALEILIRGAFWEGMAHKAFRDSAEVVRRNGRRLNVNGERKGIHDWFADVFAHTPGAEAQWETMSGSIFDRTSPLFSDPLLNRVLPRFIDMIEQVAEWKLLEPIPCADAVEAIHRGVYWELSKAVHLIPDKTLLGRQFSAGKSAFPAIEFSPDELTAFVEMLEIVADVGIVLSLNLTAAIHPDKAFVAKQFDPLCVRMREVLSRGFCGDWNLR
jgi:hypothetical protein